MVISVLSVRTDPVLVERQVFFVFSLASNDKVTVDNPHVLKTHRAQAQGREAIENTWEGGLVPCGAYYTDWGVKKLGEEGRLRECPLGSGTQCG